jgi:colicin import membrane protein
MRALSLLCSLLLHVLVVVAALYWSAAPSAVRVRLDVPVYQVELVTLAETTSKPKRARPPAPAPAKPKPAPPKPAAKPEPKPVAKPEPKPVEPQVKEISAEKKVPEKPLPKLEPEPKPEPKPEPEKPPEPTPQELLAAALREAKQSAADRERQERKQLAKELAAARRTAEARSGEPEVGAEEGAVSLTEIYSALVEREIKRNWRFPNLATRENPTCLVEIKMDKEGRILDYTLLRPSGRADFDNSALKAVDSTEQLPPPPNVELRTIRINFNLQEPAQ